MVHLLRELMMTIIIKRIKDQKGKKKKKTTK